MIWFIIEIIILALIFRNIIKLLLDNTMDIRQNFNEYLEMTILFVIVLIITIVTTIIVFA